jgi:predicted nuclease of predicted toxin-antitoxin system
MLPELDWEIWLDCNLSPAIAKWMKEDTGWDVKSAYSLQLYHLTDAEIYQKAKAAGKVIPISKDADFPEFINRYGAPPKLINIRMGNCDNKILWQFLRSRLNDMIRTDSSKYSYH